MVELPLIQPLNHYSYDSATALDPSWTRRGVLKQGTKDPRAESLISRNSNGRTLACGCRKDCIGREHLTAFSILNHQTHHSNFWE